MSEERCPSGRAGEAEQWQRSSGKLGSWGEARGLGQGWAWGMDIHSISHLRDWVTEVSTRHREQGPLPGLAGAVLTQLAAGTGAGKISGR